MLRTMTVILLCSLVSALTMAEEIKDIGGDQVIEELHSCVLEAIRTNDNGTSLPRDVAAASVKSCDTEAYQAAKVASEGKGADYLDTFYAALKTGDYFIPAVLEERSIRTDADSYRKRYAADAYAKALDNFKSANDAGKTDEANHWSRVAVRLSEPR